MSNSPNSGATAHIVSTLPRGWQLDDYYREEIYRQIRVELAKGRTQREVAKIVGCADRTVNRMVNPRLGPASHRCGARRYRIQKSGNRTVFAGRCRHLVREGKRFCADHEKVSA